MMDSIFTMCLFAFMVVVVLLVLSRLVRGGTPTARANYPRGNDYPQYDDPNIESRGSFGNASETPSYDDPTIRSGGSFGGTPTFSSGGPKSGSSGGGLGRGRLGGGTRLGGSRRADSPSVQSRGGFGRGKK
jgi:hypothetical protein